MIIEPKNETPWPKKSSRKSRCRRSGPMSIVASFSAERTRPGSGTGRRGPEPLGLAEVVSAHRVLLPAPKRKQETTWSSTSPAACMNA